MRRITVADEDDSALRRLRIERGLTLQELATRSGLAKGSLSRLETGHVGPTLPTARMLARALDLSIDDIFPEDE